MERPHRNPRGPAVISAASKGSSQCQTALAKSLLSAFTRFNGRASAGGNCGAPPSLSKVGAFGRYAVRLSLHPGRSRWIASSASGLEARQLL
eukprot:2193012-Pyramimonas_sp.AAC.1